MNLLHFGSAESLFQLSGLGTFASATPNLPGECNWNRWLTPEHIEGTEDGDYERFFVDILTDPDPFIRLLKEMNMTAYRFSMEWSVMEPARGVSGTQAIALYANFIKKLLEADIEPYITLVHFTLPRWFVNKGAFENSANIELFKRYALRMIRKFPEVNYWITFNEANIYAFQTYVRGVYPHRTTGITLAKKVMKNLLLAHCGVYDAVKADEALQEKQIGITHQWLKFEPLCGNFLERLICRYLSKISHYTIYDFFKKNPSLDFIGVQFYGYPRLKAGWNGGIDYPGYKTKNFAGWTFGSTCPEGGRMQSFGPSYYPESLQDCLEEASALGVPIVITETGCDSRIQRFGETEWYIDEEIQKEYLEEILPILAQFPLQGLFIWTLPRKELEWERGSSCCLGVVEVCKDENRRFVGVNHSAASIFLRQTFARLRQFAATAPAIC